MHGMRVVGWTLAICVMGMAGIIPGLLVKERDFNASLDRESAFSPA